MAAAIRSVQSLLRARHTHVHPALLVSVLTWATGCTDSSSGPGANGGNNPGGAAVPALTTLGRWWGTVPGSGTASSSLVALDVVVDEKGAATQNFWYGGMLHPLSIALADAMALAAGGPMLQVDVQINPATPPTNATLLRSRARLVHPGAFAITPVGYSSDGHFVAYTTTADNHPWAWDASQQTRFDLAAGVDSAHPLAQSGDKVSGAVSVDGSRSAYCISRASGSATSLFVFSAQAGSSHWIADGANCSPSTIVFSPDASRLAYSIAGADGGTAALQVWDSGTGSSFAVASAMGAGPYWFGASAKYLFYLVGASSAAASNYAPLFVYDADAQSAQSLGMARWLSPSTDGHYLAFERSDSTMVVWNDTTGTATALDSMRSDSNGNTPIHLSPDGKKVLYLDANLNLRLLVFGQSAGSIIANSADCSGAPGAVPIAVEGGTFSADSTTVGAVAPVASQCNQGTAPQAVHLFDIASSTDQSNGLPTSTSTQPGTVLGVSSGAVAYAYSGNGGYQAQVWSPMLGNVSVPLDPVSNGMALYAALSRDGNRGVFALDRGGDPHTVSLWDRMSGTTTLATFTTSPKPTFIAALDPTSGIAVAFDSSKGFVVARPGMTPASWVQGDNKHLASAGGKTFAVEGTAGTDAGVFALSFASGSAAFLEGGQLVAATDAHVYFVAADGLCEADAQ